MEYSLRGEKKLNKCIKLANSTAKALNCLFVFVLNLTSELELLLSTVIVYCVLCIPVRPPRVDCSAALWA